MQKHKLDFLIALTLALSAFILGALNLHDGQTWSGEDGGNGDFAQYLLQAIALNEGRISEFIEKSAFMTLNSYDGMGPIIYPWGYPLLLSLGIKVFGLHILSLKYINLIFFACFVGGFYIFCKNTMERKLAIYGALLFVCSPYFVHFHNRLLSDVPFMCVGFLGAILLQKYFMPPPPQGVSSLHYQSKL